MQTVYANLADGTRYLLFDVGLDFDVQSWANARSSALRLLNVVKLTVELRLAGKD